MKVWIVSEGEPLPIDDDKVRLRRMGQLSNMLTELGHEVHWFCSTFHHYKKVERYIDDRDVVNNNKYYLHLLKGKEYFNNVSFSRILHHKRIANKFRIKSKILDKPDVILATMAPLEFSGAAVEYAQKNNIPVIVDIRDLWPEIYKEVVPLWAKRLIIPYIMLSKYKLKKILKDTTGIVAVTSGFLDYGLQVAGLKRRNTDKVFHTSYSRKIIELSSFESEWSNYKLSKNDYIITFMGNFGKQFEIKPIVQAAKLLEKHSNIKFVLCGVGENYEYYKELTRYSSNLIMPGWIEGKQIQTLLLNSKIGIAPYKNSVNFVLNAPNKFGEYLSYGIPVLLSISGEMENLALEYSCGLVYSDFEDLAEKIEHIYKDQGNQKLMAANAMRLYNDKFDSKLVYRNFVEYIEEIGNHK